MDALHASQSSIIKTIHGGKLGLLLVKFLKSPKEVTRTIRLYATVSALRQVLHLGIAEKRDTTHHSTIYGCGAAVVCGETGGCAAVVSLCVGVRLLQRCDSLVVVRLLGDLGH